MAESGIRTGLTTELSDSEVLLFIFMPLAVSFLTLLALIFNNVKMKPDLEFILL